MEICTNPVEVFSLNWQRLNGSEDRFQESHALLTAEMWLS